MTAPYQVGGGLPLDAPTYVERQADQDFYDALRQGDYCYVLNSRQMGKTSLRDRTLQRLQNDGVACAAIDLAEIGTEQLTPTEWYAGLVDLLAENFGLRPEFDLGTWWEAQHPLSPVQRFGKLLHSELLARVTQPIVIFIDEIDSVLSLGFSHDDFFALIRACFNRRNDDPSYRRLTFALLGVATSADLIQDNERTPFNIGRSIPLTGFTLAEARPLANGLVGLVANPQVVLTEILRWTGGQPFLTQKLCDLVVREVVQGQADTSPPAGDGPQTSDAEPVGWAKGLARAHRQEVLIPRAHHTRQR
ncbi:AAA-like domain-containing protein [Nodosilinea sp. LEGE 07088]|uniref:AAA-like domain-containing protein n=1 Tax=Nodosilinea sp. LEGE 07088 TaxID=2777968 RepID=UPI00187E1E76|nr:AAA-like domain-containing protein [Nodosilinea sp. LEGE 07088]MBE9136316.1 AAA-like domain-containing protein [Nodosilinea sp. LEGE 07088]